MNKKNRALAVLVLFAVLAALGRVQTMAAPDSFGWGIFYHGALAGTIGGLADWFAVTALFHRPLGLTWRTEILKKNRERLMAALVDFCGRDLLNGAEIKALIVRENMAAMLAAYLNERGGREKLIAAVEEAALKTLAAADHAKLAHELAPLIARLVAAVPVDGLVRTALGSAADGEAAHALAVQAGKTAREIYASAPIQAAVAAQVAALRQDYVAGGSMREMALNMANFTAESIAARLNALVAAKLAALAERGTAEEEQLARYIGEQITSPEAENALLEICRARQNEMANPDYAEQFLLGILQQALSGGENTWKIAFRRLAETRIDEFCQSEEWQKKFDGFIKNYLSDALDKHHDLIIGLIRERLDALTDKELVALAEDYVADDLQIIRINGSIVGGLAGAALYIIMCGMERLAGL